MVRKGDDYYSTYSDLCHPVALLDLDGAVVDRGQHLAGGAGHDDVEHGRAVALGHAGSERGAELFGILDPDAADAHRARHRGVIHLAEVGGLVAAAPHRVLQRLDVTPGG